MSSVTIKMRMRISAVVVELPAASAMASLPLLTLLGSFVSKWRNALLSSLRWRARASVPSGQPPPKLTISHTTERSELKPFLLLRLRPYSTAMSSTSVPARPCRVARTAHTSGPNRPFTSTVIKCTRPTSS